MDTKHPVISPVPRIRLRTLRMVRGSSSGDYSTKHVSSSGFEFDTLRGYEQGDDVRRIDWNSSVRTGSMMVRLFREQYNRTIIIAFDISASTYAGSGAYLKCHIMQIIAHTIAYAAESSRDAIGLCLTDNDRIIEYIPPRTGKAHMMHCLEMLDSALEVLGRDRPPSLPPALKLRGTHPTQCYGGQAGKTAGKTDSHIQFPRHCWVICITDGLIKNYESWWATLAQRCTLTVVRIRDRYEKTVPLFCTVTCYDPEDATTQKKRTLTSSLQDQSNAWYQGQKIYAKQHSIALADVIAGEPYEEAIRLFFEKGIAT